MPSIKPVRIEKPWGYELIWAVKQTLANALAVLGVSAPERMDAPAAEED